MSVCQVGQWPSRNLLTALGGSAGVGSADRHVDSLLVIVGLTGIVEAGVIVVVVL